MQMRSNVLLQTADIFVQNKECNKTVKVKALFDSGSERSYITKRVCNFLDLPTESNECVSISTFGNPKTTSTTVSKVSFNAVCRNQTKFEMSALCYNMICLPLQNQRAEISHKYFDEKLDFADCDLGGEIDLLIGSDCYWELVTGRVVRSNILDGLLNRDLVGSLGVRCLIRLIISVHLCLVHVARQNP